MLQATHRRLVALAAVSAVLGCDADAPSGESLWSGPQPPGNRTFVEIDWSVEWSLGTDPAFVLASPRHLTAVDSVVVWWDDYDHQVHAVGLDGRPRWSFGSEGEGPDEFSSAGDLAIDAQGGVLVLDSDNGRITTLSSDGTRRGLASLPEGYWRGLAPQPGGAIVVAGTDGRHPFALVDTTGSLHRRFEAPWEGFETLSLIQRQGSIIGGEDGRWAYAFSIGNGWLPFRGDEPAGYLGRSIEHTDFPEMVVVGSRSRRVSKLVDRPNCSACAGWIHGDTLSILFGGYTGDANRLVDQYAWSDGRYLRSIRLPERANGVVVVGDLTILLTRAMEPTLVAYSSTPADAATREDGDEDF